MGQVIERLYAYHKGKGPLKQILKSLCWSEVF